MSTFQPRRDKMVRTEGVAPSRACAHRILAPARILFRHIRKNWSIHRDVRPAVCLTKTVRRFLRVGCKVVEAEGLAPSEPARATRLQRAAIAALPRFDKMGARPGFAPATLSLWWSRAGLLRHRAKNGGTLRKCSEYRRLRAGGFTVRACDPKNGWGRRTRTSIHGFKVRYPAN